MTPSVYVVVALFVYTATAESSTKSSASVHVVATLAGLAWPVFLQVMLGLIVGEHLRKGGK